MSYRLRVWLQCHFHDFLIKRTLFLTLITYWLADSATPTQYGRVTRLSRFSWVWLREIYTLLHELACNIASYCMSGRGVFTSGRRENAAHEWNNRDMHAEECNKMFIIHTTVASYFFPCEVPSNSPHCQKWKDIKYAIVQRARRVLYVNIEQHLYATCMEDCYKILLFSDR